MKKEFAWSWTALERFRNCPKSYWHLNVAKDVKDDDNAFSASGKEIHQALYQRVVHGRLLPLNYRYLERIAKRFVGLPGDTNGELRFAMARDFSPVEYFSRSTYVRSVVDLLNVDKSTALVVDWKTGKVKPGFDQLKLSAAVLASHLPEIEEFKLAYVWLSVPTITTLTVKKADLLGIWNQLLPEVNKIEAAIVKSEFPAKPSGLCGYCPVVACVHNTNTRLKDGHDA